MSLKALRALIKEDSGPGPPVKRKKCFMLYEDVVTSQVVKHQPGWHFLRNCVC